MIKRALVAVLVCFSFCFPLVAQQTHPIELNAPGIFSAFDAPVLLHGLPLSLLDGQRFARASALGRMGTTPADLFPIAYLRPVDPPRRANVSSRPEMDGPDDVAELRSNRVYTSGEVGVFYGKSTGKYGGSDFQAYMTSTVGNDKFQITAGASYEETSVRIPWRGR